MKQGYFISQGDFRLLATVAETMLESADPPVRELGNIITAVTLRTATSPVEVGEDDLDEYWDKVCEQHDRDILANHPPMEGWDVVWAQVDKRLRGES